MKNLDEIRRLGDAIVDQNWSMHQLPHSWFSLNRAAYVRKALENVQMIQYGVTKVLGGRWEVGPRVRENLLEVC